MKRASSMVWGLPGILLLTSVVYNDASAQEPKRFTLQKSQRLTSMTPNEDVTVGGIAQPADSSPVISSIRPNEFSVPGWESHKQKYLVLGRAANSHSSKVHRDQGVVMERRPVEPYAYGWFGAKMNRHPHRSFGYQQAYTQWAFE